MQEQYKSPSANEQWSLNLVAGRFKSTYSVEINFKDNHEVIIVRSYEFGKSPEAAARGVL